MAFHKTFVDDDSFIRGAGRLVWAEDDITFPGSISDIIELGATPMTGEQYDAKTGWFELGATKTGIQITINNAEETFDVDQILGDIESQPTNWECSIGTQLAEMTVERLQVAWEGSDITEDTSEDIDEKEIGFGQPASYTRRRLAVLYQRPNGLIRAYIFRKVQRMPQESSVTHNKTGEQISVPVRWKALADSTEPNVKKRFFIIRDQQVTTP